MDFKARYENEDDKTIVNMIESPADFVKECRDAVYEILEERAISKEELKQFAKDINRSKARAQFEKLDPLNDEIQILESAFLTEEELKPIYADELNAFMQDRDGFRFNVWLYALGG